MHLFTLIQVFAMAALWAVKLSPAALAFPFVLILLVPVRLFLFKYLFSEQELEQVRCGLHFFVCHFVLVVIGLGCKRFRVGVFGLGLLDFGLGMRSGDE